MSKFHMYHNFEVLRFFEGVASLEWEENHVWKCDPTAFENAIWDRVQECYPVYKEKKAWVLSYQDRLQESSRSSTVITMLKEILDQDRIDLLIEILEDLDMGL